ncbi:MULTISPECIES: hypothetical protein [Bacillaceae]|uniref:hypothetical protein n=1 Tax=Bacillaceae TaxID=186817 RepID=UPI000A2AD862|nr:hypothetical protein [Bacillus sp. OV166]SMQ84475.1 hypothetical protein SAMN05444673_5924 [Bacillus sp. OV166]
MLYFLLDLLDAMFTGSTTGLDTRRIDRNIEQLKQQDWFKKIYNDEKYRRLFYVNRHVRGYLQSTRRVKKIIRNQKAQKKLMVLLNKQIQNSGA